MTRSLFVAIALPFLAACPGNGPTTCTRSVETALSSASGSATQTDAGTLVTLEWPAPTSTLPPGYFMGAQARASGQAELNRFTVFDAGAEAEFAPIAGGFSFTVMFPEPDRLAGGDECDGQHGGMDDTIELEIVVSPLGASGTRAVSTSASVQLGAY